MNHSPKYTMQPLKVVATINDEVLSEETDPDYELQYIDISNVSSSGLINEIAKYNFENAPSRARRLVRDGDVIISTVRTYLLSIAPIQSPPDNLVVSTGFAVIRPRAGVLVGEYCKYALREPSFINEVIARSTGINYPAIKSSELGNLLIYVPTLSEQQAIVAYLDRETAKLNTLLNALEQLQTLLAEKRRALIAHTVTRGLNSAAPLRDSGVEWLGEIPKHWEVARLKTLCSSLQTGPFGSQLHAEEYVDNGIPVINPAHLVDNRIVPDYSVSVNEWMADYLSIHKLEVGDIVFARRGEIGRCGLVTEKEVGWLCGTGSLRARPNQEVINPEYLIWLITNSFAGDWLSLMAVGTTMSNLNTAIVGDLALPVPPLQEQREIADYLELKIGAINALHSAIQTTINLLQERRTSLISAVVSGQMRV